MDAVIEGGLSSQTLLVKALLQRDPSSNLFDARPRSIVVADLGDVSLPSHPEIPHKVPSKSLQHFNRQCFIATNSLSFSPDSFTDPLAQLQTASLPFISITATPFAALSSCPDQNIRSRNRLFDALEMGGPFLRP
ncbi:hypothetical protein BFJ68_g17429 [Fusarium oxysporum]|uniref:Uncharacterized protein n=1 Tax=Fusarium oxysporum TaxID=5507 RepID=A0A420NTG9_FUSOX|nr:hypothetical protein BFJ68_g17429 [Fusarium oxysporum]